jgi:hypothetical protein
MSNFKLTGTLKVKNAEQQVSEKFRKREFVLTTDGPYPQHINMQLTQDRCGLIEPFNLGDELTVSFDVKGREWTGKEGEVKYFNSIEAFRIEGTPSAAGAATASSNAGNLAQTPSADSFSQSAENDLPF